MNVHHGNQGSGEEQMAHPRIAHLIADLNGFGGTEATLLRYINGSGIPRHCHRVIVLKQTGTGNTIGTQMIAAGIPMLALEQKGSLMSPAALRRLHVELQAFAPDVISGWLYHCCLLATALAGMLARRPAVVWHFRCSTFSSLRHTPVRFLTQRMLRVLAPLTAPVMVSNSRVAVADHAALGFDARPERWHIIHNGIDTRHYRPDPHDRQAVRRELGIAANALVVGCVGRLVPEKSYDTMLQAMAAVLRMLPAETAARLHFVGMGQGVSAANPAFNALMPPGLPADRLHLLDKRADVARLLRALDIYVLSSVSEAFPNSLAEAMASGLACVSTAVGECPEVLALPDCIVPAGDAERLASRIAALAATDEGQRRAIGDGNRQRIMERFTLAHMVERFDAVFLDAAGMADGAGNMAAGPADAMPIARRRA